MLEELRSQPGPLYDVPEAAALNLGFPCAPSTVNKFEDLVLLKGALFERRGDSYRALGKAHAALTDYKYAVSISPLRELDSLRLCELEIELQFGYDAVKDCRWAFDFDTFPILSDSDQAAKIGNFLLKDGDLKGACRIAFPFVRDKSMQRYLDDPKIKTLQERVRNASQGAGVANCEPDLRLPAGKQ